MNEKFTNARAVAEKCAEIASQIAGGDPAYCVEAICAYAATLPDDSEVVNK